jgi:hypothetical protein
MLTGAERTVVVALPTRSGLEMRNVPGPSIAVAPVVAQSANSAFSPAVASTVPVGSQLYGEDCAYRNPDCGGGGVPAVLYPNEVPMFAPI